MCFCGVNVNEYCTIMLSSSEAGGSVWVKWFSMSQMLTVFIGTISSEESSSSENSTLCGLWM